MGFALFALAFILISGFIFYIVETYKVRYPFGQVKESTLKLVVQCLDAYVDNIPASIRNKKEYKKELAELNVVITQLESALRNKQYLTETAYNVIYFK